MTPWEYTQLTEGSFVRISCDLNTVSQSFGMRQTIARASFIKGLCL